MCRSLWRTVCPLVRSRLLPDELVSGDEHKRPGPRTRPDLRFYVVGATGFEPVTSSVSGHARPFARSVAAVHGSTSGACSGGLQNRHRSAT